MANCKKCGKKGFFLKLNRHGLCFDCELKDIQLKEQEINKRIKEQELFSSRLNEDIEKIKSDKVNIVADFKAEALKEAEGKVAAIGGEIDDKKAELSELQSDVLKSKKELNSNSERLYKIKEAYKSMQYATSGFNKNLDEISTNLNNNTIASAEALIAPTVQLSLNCLNLKELRKRYNQNYKLIEDVLKRYKDRYTTKANATIYNLMVIALEAELQNVLYSINYGKLDVAVQNIKAITEKYYLISTDGNQSIAATIKKFIGEIEYLFTEAVKIEYEYYVQKERIKQEQQALREQMRQEARERKILEDERKKIEKEENKYKTEIDHVKELLAAATDDEQAATLNTRLGELQSQLDTVETEKEKILKLQNGKAGSVYVISNLGSFGDNVFKVGMTRRTEPMDRIRELGDASVPFSFDVHATIFTDDAVGLEHNLHMALNDKRVNKVNLRKEFFKIPIDELADLVYQFQPTAEFKKTMLAEQYYQGLSIDSPLEELSDDFADDDLAEDET